MRIWTDGEDTVVLDEYFHKTKSMLKKKVVLTSIANITSSHYYDGEDGVLKQMLSKLNQDKLREVELDVLQ